MLAPLTDEEYEQHVPTWAKEINKEPRCPLVVGLPVFDVLYAGKYRNGDAYGVIKYVTPDGSFVHVDDFAGKWRDGSAAAYWVPDLTTEAGRDHYEAWKAGRNGDQV